MTATVSRNIKRSTGMGILFSMLFFYWVHVLGSWKVENYQPDPQTTGTLLLHNTCAVLGHTHTLRPNTDVPVMGDGINGLKLSGSFMNFTDGHITGMVILSILAGSVIFIGRRWFLASSISATR